MGERLRTVYATDRGVNRLRFFVRLAKGEIPGIVGPAHRSHHRVVGVVHTDAGTLQYTRLGGRICAEIGIAIHVIGADVQNSGDRRLYWYRSASDSAQER